MRRRGEWLAVSVANYLRRRGIERGRILDVGCGTGRVAIPLAMQGFDVVGIDISPRYIEIATKRARELGLETHARFVLCDAREMAKCLQNYKPFDVVLFVWSTVIGYYDREDDVEILRQALELSHGETLLIIADTASKDFISFLSNFVGNAKWFVDYDDYAVVESPLFNPVTGELITKQVFYAKKGRNLEYVGEANFKIKLYSLDELVSMAREAGWCLVEALKSFASEEPYVTLGAINAVFKPCRG